MKYFLSIIVLGFSLSSFAQAPKLVSDHFQALNAHDSVAVASGYKADAMIFSPNWQGVKTGTAAIRQVYHRYFTSTADISYQVTHVINAGKEIIVEYTVSGTFSNPEAGSPPYMQGKKYSLNYCALLTISNGKILKETDYFDQVAFLRQVGFFDQH